MKQKRLNPSKRLSGGCRRCVLAVWLLLAASSAQGAVADLEAAVRKSPQDAAAWCALGDYYYSQRDYAAAEAPYQKALSLDPNYFRALFKLGNLYYHTGKLDEAEKAFRKVTALAPDYWQPHLNLATIHEARRQFADAAKEYARANELAPDRPEPYYGIGDVFYKMERWDSAIRYYEAGLQAAPEPASDLEKQDRELTEQYLARARIIQKNGGVIPSDQIYDSLTRPAATRGVLFSAAALADQAAVGKPALAPEIESEGSTRQPPKEISLRRILFDTNKYAYESLDATSRRQLEELAEAMLRLAAEGTAKFLIEGHTDEIGPEDYNDRLSLKRAETVRDYLRKSGLAARLEVKGLGEREPACVDHNEEAWRLNRRVVVKRMDAALPETPAPLITAQAPPEPAPTAEAELDIRVFYRKGSGEPQRLGAGKPLPAGAEYRIEFETPLRKTAAHVYVLQERKNGAIECLFPAQADSASEKSKGNPVAPGKIRRLPCEEEFYKTSVEDRSFIIRFYTSEQPLENLEKILAQGKEAGTIQRRGILPFAEPDRPFVAAWPDATPPPPGEAATPTPAPGADAAIAGSPERLFFTPGILEILPSPVSEIEIRVE